ncbi:MAG: hypothetical protein V3S41_03960 [Spirochaetia bacterium]
MNHAAVGVSSDEDLISSLDSFLVGLPPGSETDALMVEAEFGDTVRVVGFTRFVSAGFGTFQHLLIEVETFENLGR